MAYVMCHLFWLKITGLQPISVLTGDRNRWGLYLLYYIQLSQHNIKV